MQNLISDNQDFEDIEQPENLENKVNMYDGMPYSAASSGLIGNLGKQMPDPNEEGNKRYISGYKDLTNHKKQYVLNVISQYDVTIGVVSHLMNYDIKNELDPLLIERIKNSLKHLSEKHFIKNLN